MTSRTIVYHAYASANGFVSFLGMRYLITVYSSHKRSIDHCTWIPFTNDIVTSCWLNFAATGKIVILNNARPSEYERMKIIKLNWFIMGVGCEEVCNSCIRYMHCAQICI